MTREQAMKYLPALFRKMGTGMSIDTVASATAFIDFLYRHGFIVLSRAERAKLERGKAV